MWAWWLAAATAALIALLVLLALVPARVGLEGRLGDGARAVLEVRWLGLGFRREWSSQGQADGLGMDLVVWALVEAPGRRRACRSVRKWGRQYRRLASLVRYLGPRVRISRLRLLAQVGTGDPALTALTCGAFWILFGHVLAAVRAAAPLPPAACSAAVRPSFTAAGLQGLAECRLEVRPAHLLRAALLARRWRGIA